MKFVVAVGVFFSFLPLIFAQPCLQRQGAIDIGSGSVKLFAAVVDTCNKTIVETLYEDGFPLQVNDALERSDDDSIPLEFLEKEAVPQLEKQIKAMKEKEVSKITGFATAAFRKASNGERALFYLSQKLKVDLKIITQRKESDIAALSVLDRLKIKNSELQNIVIWDIGGGSMQMRGTNSNGNLEIYEGDLASVTFKNKIIQEVLKKDLKKVTSPNPLGDRYKIAARQAQQHAKESVSDFFRSRPSSTRWIGVGGVLARSVQEQVDSKSSLLEKKKLERVLKIRANLSDHDLEGDYKATDVTNLALVLGFMEALQIKKMETTSVYLGAGWLLFQLN